MSDDFLYHYSPSQQEREAIFASSCIESVARELGMAPNEVYERMSRIKLIEEYILPCYDVLHSESRKNVTEDIIHTMELWEARVAASH
ncbi:MAG: DUF3791 domain-containing protein [Bacteroidaceae bacterium]|nr:DUF3791 domain-containing protein [Bacteroidaceae bacterium]